MANRRWITSSAESWLRIAQTLFQRPARFGRQNENSHRFRHLALDLRSALHVDVEQ